MAFASVQCEENRKSMFAGLLPRFHNALGCIGLHVCAIEIDGSCSLFCFELFNSPFQSFNPGFHVLVDLGGISIIKFIRSVLPHGRLLMTTINR
jgi:hypothetical protein